MGDEIQYKPNSHKFKEDQNKPADKEVKRVEKVVSGTAKTRKKSEFRKFTDELVSEDARGVGSRVLMEVLLPMVKRVIVDMITEGANIVFYGGSSGRKSSTSGGYVSYRNYSDRPGSNYQPSRDSRSSGRFDYEDIGFPTRGEAEAAFMQLEDVIDKYGYATVADLYDMADLTAPYTSNRYGWTSMRNAIIASTRDGYVIKMPRAMPID